MRGTPTGSDYIALAQRRERNSGDKNKPENAKTELHEDSPLPRVLIRSAGRVKNMMQRSEKDEKEGRRWE
ncbi:MAG: hypothetical protein V1798_05100 [Pseudomonadota bacterium]